MTEPKFKIKIKGLFAEISDVIDTVGAHSICAGASRG